MGGHKRYGGLSRSSHSGDELPSHRPGNSQPRLRISRPGFWIIAIAGLAGWSLLAWVGYALVDPILGWVTASAGLLADGATDLASVTGTGKEVGSILDSLNTSGFLGQAIAWLGVVLKPAIVIVWAIGAVVLIAAPMVLPRIGRLLGGRRH